MHVRILVVVLMLFTSSVARAAVTFVEFEGVTGACLSGPLCNEFTIGVGEGVPYTGSFTYSNFGSSNSPNVSVATVGSFEIVFPNVTLTATEAVLLIRHHNGRTQMATLIGAIPGGLMLITVNSSFLPARTDLLNNTGVTWDCEEWGTCGMLVTHIFGGNLAAALAFNNGAALTGDGLPFTTFAAGALVSPDHPNGTLSFTNQLITRLANGPRHARRRDAPIEGTR